MAVFSRTKSAKNESVFFDFFKGLLVATVCSLALIVLFAFCIKWFDIGDEVLNIGTLGVKATSVLIGSIVAVKGQTKGLLKGAGFGFVYIIFAFLIFSILAGTFDIGLSFLLDLVSASLLGGIVGIIKVNRK